LKPLITTRGYADASGVPLRQMSNKIIKEAATHQPFPPAPVSDASFVLLCLENSVRLYSASSVIQVGLGLIHSKKCDLKIFLALIFK
jgi:hypothetical protein